jgi:hypothetical protein
LPVGATTGKQGSSSVSIPERLAGPAFKLLDDRSDDVERLLLLPVRELLYFFEQPPCPAGSGW